MSAPHRVLRDSELTATRLVAAVRERVAFDPCASCEPARCRGDARKSTDDDDDGATTELTAPIGSPLRATDARDDWTRAYEAFRASADGESVGAVAVRRGERAIARGFGFNLERRDGGRRIRESRGGERALAGEFTARGRGRAAREGARFAANRDGDSRRRAIRRLRDRDSALYRYVVTLTFTRVNFTRRENRARDARAAWIRSRRRETRETSVTV